MIFYACAKNAGNNSIIKNSTISDNTARNNGGGIYNNGTINVTGTTITNNRSSANPFITSGGGGIFNNGSATANLFNTIIAANFSSSTTGAPDFNGTIASGSSYNIIGNNQLTTGVTDGGNGNQVGTPTNPIDPKLGALANNGGATETHALLPNSPAIDKGSSFAINTDQRGLTRPVDLPLYANASDGADIGAYELQSGPTAALVTVTGRVAASNNRGIFGATVTLTTENGEILYTRTSTGGYYRFTDVAAGSNAVVAIVSKRYNFAPQVITITGDLSNVDFFAQTELLKR